jgi:hypothetical protein
MNTPIAPIPAPPKPEVPREPISAKKVVLYVVLSFLVLTTIVLASWEDGRVNLFASLNFKGYKRRQADRYATTSNGNKANYAEAFRLYQLDAEKGDGEALRKIGEMYRDGRGVPQNEALARESWKKAAASGDINTLIWLAEKNRTGDGRTLPVNHPESIRLLRRAASQGNAGAQVKLARQLLAYDRESPINLELDEILSTRQREDLLTLPNIKKLFKAKADGLDKLTKKDIKTLIAGAEADMRTNLSEKFNWEAYFWLSLATASDDDADLRATRDGVNAKLQNAQVERVQKLVSGWARADAPGNEESPFVKDEGPVAENPEAPKQTLSALLEELSEKASKMPDSPPPSPYVRTEDKPAAPKTDSKKTTDATPPPTVNDIAKKSADIYIVFLAAQGGLQTSAGNIRNLVLQIDTTPTRDFFGNQIQSVYLNDVQKGIEIAGKNYREIVKLKLKLSTAGIDPDVVTYIEKLTAFDNDTADAYDKWLKTSINQSPQIEAIGKLRDECIKTTEVNLISSFQKKYGIQLPTRQAILETTIQKLTDQNADWIKKKTDKDIFKNLVGRQFKNLNNNELWTVQSEDYVTGKIIKTSAQECTCSFDLEIALNRRNTGEAGFIRVRIFYARDLTSDTDTRWRVFVGDLAQ